MLKPLFIIGSPRSCLSLVLELLAIHPQIGWISKQCTRSPDKLELNKRRRYYQLPIIGKHLYAKHVGSKGKGWNSIIPSPMDRTFKITQRLNYHLPFPGEGWGFWGHYLKSFLLIKDGYICAQANPLPEDISASEINKINQIVSKILVLQNSTYFAAFYSNNPRIAYLKKAFPEARFLHLVRDGRAVCESLMKRMTKGLSFVWENRASWFEEIQHEWNEAGHKKYDCPMGLCAFIWKHYLRQTWRERATIPDSDYFELAYEDLISDPGRHIESILKFAEIPSSNTIHWYLKKNPPGNSNIKWRKKLQKKDLELFDDIVTEHEFRKLLRNDK